MAGTNGPEVQLNKMAAKEQRGQEMKFCGHKRNYLFK